MRIFALFTLISYLLIAASPFALAETTEETNATCKFGGLDDGYYFYTYDPENKDAQKEEYEAWIKMYEELVTDEGLKGSCGEVNSNTGYLEKGDCTESGDLITEISEVVGNETDVNDGEQRIINVYKGACCLVAEYQSGESNFTCKEIRNVYFKEFTECNDNAVGCEKRQWIISTSGAGLLKVYIKQMYVFGAGFVGLSAMIAIVISGIQISVSGVSGDITSAKNRIIQAISALVLLFLSGLILYTVNPTFFGS